MAEIGCNWARIGPSKSSQSLSIAHKWAVVGDEAVHKELGDRMERAATTASSFKAEQDSGRGEGLMGGGKGGEPWGWGGPGWFAFCGGRVWVRAREEEIEGGGEYKGLLRRGW
ncbi:hypothetical protein Tco_0718330 [Tanacetum coccineum]